MAQLRMHNSMGEEVTDGQENPGMLPGVELTPYDYNAPLAGRDEAAATGLPVSGELGRSGEGPRERANPGTGNTTLRGLGEGTGTGPNAEATEARPRVPTPQAGSSFSAGSGGSSEGVQPFSPMGSPDVGSMTSPRLRGLYGSQGGLQGGGLGVPLDPTSNQRSNPIDMLLELLSKSR